MRFQELISTYPVNQLYAGWDDSTKEHFQKAMVEITEVLGCFDIWPKEDGRSLRCGFKKLTRKKGVHLLQIGINRGGFKFGINFGKCGEGRSRLYESESKKLGSWEPQEDSQGNKIYFNWHGKNQDEELADLLEILGENKNSASLTSSLPDFTGEMLPADYDDFKSLLSKFDCVDGFPEHIKNCSEETIRAFCRIINDSRMRQIDCYSNNPSEGFDIRLGRKDLDAKKGAPVFAEFYPTASSLRYEIRFINGRSLDNKQDSGRIKGEVNSEAVALFEKYYPKEFREKYWRERDPYWPSDYNDNSNASSDEPEQPSKESCMQTPSLNQILFGPPGTGKTYNTIEKAVLAAEPCFDWNGNREILKDKYNELVAENRIRFVTFHQSYGYEEFVEGLSVEVEDGKPHYFVKDGIFKRIVKDANDSFERDEETQNYVLVIDEINRGNISKIFGELITLIEESKRKGEDETIELDLPYSGEKFSVPNNLILIGTMNTADRSLAVMDTALRRRFDFTEMMPDASVLQPKLSSDDFNIDLVTLLNKMNARIEYLLDREHTLGHAFFIPVVQHLNNNKPDEALTELKKVFQNKVLPLLQEYFFDDWHKIRLVLGDNQEKQDQALAFVRSEKVEVKALFGSDDVNQFGEPESKFTLSEPDASVWNSAKAYQGIYEVLS